MPRRPTDSYWVERVRSIVENQPRRSIQAIGKTLEIEANELKRDDYPSERTIRRIREEYHGLTQQERRNYRLVYWPESFERGDLPWESASVIVELLTFGLSENGVRPPVRFANWFWRVTQAAPGLSQDKRIDAARNLDAVDAGWLRNESAVRRNAENVVLGLLAEMAPMTVTVAADGLRDFVELADASGLKVGAGTRTAALFDSTAPPSADEREDGR